MYTQNDVLKDYKVAYPLEQKAPLEKICFLDIETTGLSPQTEKITEFGIMKVKNN